MFTVALLGGAAFVAPQTATASPSGWYVATVPGTGSNDVLLGTTCANAQQCWSVGITLNGLGGGSPSSVTPLVEAWNGSGWALVPVSLPAGVTGGGFFDATCVNGADCWAVGAEVDIAGNGNPTGTLIEHWDGTAWSAVTSPSPGGPGVQGAILSGVSCASASSCVAVGYATDDTGANLTDVIEQWNGTSWTIVPGAATGQAFDQLTAVQCLSASNCWAVGNAGPAQQDSSFLPIFPGAVGDQGLIEHWDGSAWSVVPSVAESTPNGGYLSGLACTSANNCWASGATTDTSGTQAGDLDGALGRLVLGRRVGLGAGLHRTRHLVGHLVRERSAVLGCRVDRVIRRVGRRHCRALSRTGTARRGRCNRRPTSRQ